MPAAFRIGGEVEVRSTEEGLQGSWYEATVTRSHLNRRFYDVQYTTLLADDASARPLVESVRASHLRPRAPRLAPAAGYAVEDLVDGFHNDGWWPGIVSATDGSAPPGRYTVCFPSSREVIEFAPSEIRPCLQWRHGRWLPHENTEEALFREGEQVEVSGDKENYGTTWFMATVVKVLAKTIYLVEYRKPNSDGGHDLLREFLDVQYVRPVPPSTSDGKHFDLHEEIEVCICGVWMVGVILKMVGNSRYTVKLRSPKEEELELSQSEIRRLRTWINGQWECVAEHSGRPSLAGEKPDEPLSVSYPRKSKRKMRQGPTTEGKAKALLSNKKLKNGDPSDQLRMEIYPGTPTVDKESLAALQEFESPPSGLVTLVSKLHVDEGLHKSLLVNDLCVEQRWPKLNNTTESEVLGETPSHCMGNLQTTQNINHSLSPREIGNFVLSAERGNSKGVCDNSVSVMKRAKELAHRKLRCQEDTKRRSKAKTKKKRSRPRKQSTESIISMNVACTELEQPKRTGNGDADSKETNKGATVSKRDLLHNDASNSKANTQVGQQVARALIQDGTSPSFFTENVQEISRFANGLNDTAVEVETRDLPPTLKEDCAIAPDLTPEMASCAQDAIGTSASFLTGNVQDVSNFTYGLNDTANGAKNRSLSSSPKEDCTDARSNSYNPRVCGTSRFGNMHGTEGVEAEIMSHQSETADGTDKNQTSSMPPSRSVNVEEMGLTDPSPTASTIARPLPFVKHSSLWEEIDSMEVFRVMPQKPHFHALEQQYSREYREGMAIGLMVTFANLEAGMRKLDVFDSQASFEEKLKTLKQLEDNGFDIQSLQSRIQQLLDIRNNILELQNQENRMKELMSKKDCIETEKNGVDKRIKEAEKCLASLSERRESLLAQHLELQKTLQATQDAYLCAELQFHTIVASLW